MSSAEDSLFKLGDIRRVREVPPEIEGALTRTAPQALLRDLHRPVSTFAVNQLSMTSVPMIRNDPGVLETTEVHATFYASYRVPICDLLHTNADMFDAYRAARAVLRTPWSDAPRLRARAQEIAKGQAAGGA